MTKKQTKPKEVGVKVRAESALMDIGAVLEKRGLMMRPVMNFPGRRSVPPVARILLWLISLFGGIMDLEFHVRK